MEKSSSLECKAQVIPKIFDHCMILKNCIKSTQSSKKSALALTMVNDKINWKCILTLAPSICPNSCHQTILSSQPNAQHHHHHHWQPSAEDSTSTLCAQQATGSRSRATRIGQRRLLATTAGASSAVRTHGTDFLTWLWTDRKLDLASWSIWRRTCLQIGRKKSPRPGAHSQPLHRCGRGAKNGLRARQTWSWCQ